MKKAIRWIGFAGIFFVIILLVWTIIRKIDHFEKNIRSYTNLFPSREAVKKSDVPVRNMHPQGKNKDFSGVSSPGNQIVDGYDSIGNLISRTIRMLSENGSVMRIVVNTFRYDSANRKIYERIDEYNSSDSLVGSVVHSYTYNDLNQRTEHVTIWLDGNGKETGKIKVLTYYNVSGKPEEEITLDQFDRPVSKSRYVYENGLMVQEHLILFDENGSVKEEKLIHYEEHALL